MHNHCRLHGYVFARNDVILGRGRHCVVKLATSTRYSTPRKVAVKITPASRASIKEAEILFQLNHDNIVEISDFFVSDAKTFLIMEVAEKGNLRTFIRHRGRVGEVLASKMCRQIFDAVAYLHDVARVVHGDIKCENVLVDGHNDLKITDFGMSVYLANEESRNSNTSKNQNGHLNHLSSGPADPAITGNDDNYHNNYDDDDDDDNFDDDVYERKVAEHSRIGGSPAYASPEVLDGIVTNLPATDVWSAGVVCFFLLTTYLPFGCQGVKSIRVAMEKPLRWPRPLRLVKKELRTFVQDALVIDASRRPNARGLYDILCRI